MNIWLLVGLLAMLVSSYVYLAKPRPATYQAIFGLCLVLWTILFVTR